VPAPNLKSAQSKDWADFSFKYLQDIFQTGIIHKKTSAQSAEVSI